MKVNTAPDFENMWEPLDQDALAILEQNNLEDPNHERLPPVPIWVNGPKPNILLDCHNTHRIREKHRLKIRYAKLNFDDRLQALDYAERIQLGRRNLTESQRAMRIAERTKQRQMRGRPATDSCAPNSKTTEKTSSVKRARAPILDEMAQSAGVGRKTMVAAVQVAEKGADEVKEGVKAGKYSARDAASVAGLTKRQQARIAAQADKQGTTLSEAAEKNGAPIDPDSLEAVQADLREYEKRLRELARFGRQILGCEGNEIKRPFCNCYSVLTLIHPLQHIARTVLNDLPVGGTSKKPVLHHEQVVEQVGR